MSTHTDTGAAMAIAVLDHAAAAAYTALRDLGLAPDGARDAIVAHVADTITTTAYDRDGVPLPTDTDDDSGGGVRPR